MAVQGVFEALDHYHGQGWFLKGWAFDPDAPDQPVQLALCTQDRVVLQFHADRYRADLADSGLGKGCHAFELPLPPSLLQEPPFSLQIAVVNERRWLPKQAIDWFSSAVSSGRIEDLEQARLNGWAVHNLPGRPPQVDISIDDQWVATISCNRERAGLQLNIQGRQGGSFSYSIPPQYYDGKPHRIAVHMANQATELQGSPLQFTLQPGLKSTRYHRLYQEQQALQQQLQSYDELLAREPANRLQDAASYAQWLPQHEARIAAFCAAAGNSGSKQHALPRIALKELDAADGRSLQRWLRQTRADAVGFVGKGDSVHAQWQQAAALALRKRQTLAVYCDEDQRSGKQAQLPFFKPAWDPERFLAQAYTGFACCVRTEVLRQALALLPQEAQDWPAQRWAASLLDLALQPLQGAQVQQLPYVLYHRSKRWKALLPGKQRAALLSSALQRQGVDASLKALPGDYLQVSYALPQPAPEVVLLIPTRDRVELLRACVDSILRLTDYPQYRILIIDNDSREAATLQYLQQMARHPQVELRQWPGAFNYAAMHNEVVRSLKTPYIALINNDIEVLQGNWLSELMQLATRPDVGAAGARLLYPNGLVQHGGVVVGLHGVADNAQRSFAGDEDGYFGSLRVVQQFSAVTAACMVLRRSDWQAVKGMDAKNLPVSFNDVDLCLKLGQTGKRILWTPHATLYHHESATRGQPTGEQLLREQREAQHMRDKWQTERFADPCYSPNLSLREQSHVDLREALPDA